MEESSVFPATTPEQIPTTPTTPEAPVETPTTTETPETPVVTPETTKPEETPAAKADDAKETPEGDGEGEEQYVSAKDYDTLKSEFEAFKAERDAAKVVEGATTETPADPKAEKAPVKEPIDLADIDPDLLVSPDEITDDVLDVYGWDPETEEGKARRPAIAKRESQLVHRAAEYGFQRAKAEFYTGMTHEVSRQVAAQYHVQRIAEKVIEAHPEVAATQESFEKMGLAIAQASGKAKVGTTVEQLAEEAFLAYREAGGVVERFSKSGGKIIKNNGSGGGTTATQKAGTPAGPPQRKGPSIPEEALKSVFP
jgi:hypothetical protein